MEVPVARLIRLQARFNTCRRYTKVVQRSPKCVHRSTWPILPRLRRRPCLRWRRLGALHDVGSAKGRWYHSSRVFILCMYISL